MSTMISDYAVKMAPLAQKSMEYYKEIGLGIIAILISVFGRGVFNYLKGAFADSKNEKTTKYGPLVANAKAIANATFLVSWTLAIAYAIAISIPSITNSASFIAGLNSSDIKIIATDCLKMALGSGVFITSPFMQKNIFVGIAIVIAVLYLFNFIFPLPFLSKEASSIIDFGRCEVIIKAIEYEVTAIISKLLVTVYTGARRVASNSRRIFPLIFTGAFLATLQTCVIATIIFSQASIPFYFLIPILILNDWSFNLISNVMLFAFTCVQMDPKVFEAATIAAQTYESKANAQLVEPAGSSQVYEEISSRVQAEKAKPIVSTEQAKNIFGFMGILRLIKNDFPTFCLKSFQYSSFCFMSKVIFILKFQPKNNYYLRIIDIHSNVYTGVDEEYFFTLPYYKLGIVPGKIESAVSNMNARSYFTNTPYVIRFLAFRSPVLFSYIFVTLRPLRWFEKLANGVFFSNVGSLYQAALCFIANFFNISFQGPQTFIDMIVKNFNIVTAFGLFFYLILAFFITSIFISNSVTQIDEELFIYPADYEKKREDHVKGWVDYLIQSIAVAGKETRKVLSSIVSIFKKK